MNLRTLLIIGGLALPLIAFAILSQSMPESSKTAPVKPVATKQAAPNAAETAPGKPSTIDDTSTPPAISADAGQVPPGVKADGMSVGPVVLPPIDKSSPQVQPAGQVVDLGAVPLEEAIKKTKDRLAYLEKMSPKEWPEERKRHPNAPATLQQALEYNRNRLANLATMTPEKWAKQQQATADRIRREWQQLSPQQQMEIYQRNQRATQADGAAPAAGR